MNNLINKNDNDIKEAGAPDVCNDSQVARQAINKSYT
jgi:hypothetical protein